MLTKVSNILEKDIIINYIFLLYLRKLFYCNLKYAIYKSYNSLDTYYKYKKFI